MTIQECYAQMGADYTQILNRFGSENMVKKFARKFLNDKTYQSLLAALEAQDAEGAFRMAHTLKGICLNLGFDRLGEASIHLTELLRPRDLSVGYTPALEAVEQEYERTVHAIAELDPE